QCEAIVHIVRAFHDDNVIHVSDKIDPRDDIEIINTELILADIQTIETRLPKIAKDAKTQPVMKATADYLTDILPQLKAGVPLSSLRDIKFEYINDLNLLTAKPVIYAFNVDEQTLVDDTKKAELAALVSPARTIFVCAKLEDELKGLAPEDAAELLESYGVKETGLLQMIHAAYDILGLQSYLTAGPKEIRAWTIKKGATAPQAAGVIHGDFERGFIAAQIVDFDELIACGSETAAKSAGKMRTEGKEYIMRPGDVVEFRFNV
ncbi:redox-regulated ATPase YchF, partial [Candidatus Saccharibacteria bacterium]|nr:redox-regulated ATPase YchF [Candidatus Saccharibacteria bacterium]